MSWSLDGRPLRRVLVTRLRYLGDIAMSTVVLAALRRGDPDLDLGYLCEASHGPILIDDPRLQRVHLLASRRRGADARARPQVDAADGAGLPGGRLAWQLRRTGYDLAVDLFFNPRSAGLLWLAGIPRRIGGATGSRRRLYTHVATIAGATAGPHWRAIAPGGLGDHLARLAPLHHQESGLPFPAWLERTYGPGELRPRVPRPHLAGAAAAALRELGVTGPGYTLLAPASTWPVKEWPVAHWQALVRGLLEAREDPIVVLAPPGGARSFGALAADVPLLPPLPLAEALRVVGGAGRLICADGGIMHAAVAMDVPTLALFGPTDPGIWFPYESYGPFRVLATRPGCSPCSRESCDEFVCLPELSPRRVLDAALALPRREEPPR